MIFCFSGTGNSLYVARELAGRLGDEITSIPQVMAAADTGLHFTDTIIGIVVPVYGHEVPAMVDDFLRESTLDASYVYVVLTYGRRHGGVAERTYALAADYGVEVAYCNTINMVDNWLPGYDMDEERAMDKHLGVQLDALVADLQSRVRYVQPATAEDNAAHEQFLSYGMPFRPDALGDFLSVTDACTGCGICTRVCPGGCIRLREGRAERNAQVNLGCNACLACVHACPARAVTMKLPERNEHAARYRNERVSLSDIENLNALPYFSSCNL